MNLPPTHTLPPTVRKTNISFKSYRRTEKEEDQNGGRGKVRQSFKCERPKTLRDNSQFRTDGEINTHPSIQGSIILSRSGERELSLFPDRSPTYTLQPRTTEKSQRLERNGNSEVFISLRCVRNRDGKEGKGRSCVCLGGMEGYKI